MTQLIAFRLLQGAGGGALMPMAFAVAGDVVPARERGRYQAYFSAAFGAASVMGPMLGGWFADQLSWRFAFWINIPLGVRSDDHCRIRPTGAQRPSAFIIASTTWAPC